MNEFTPSFSTKYPVLAVHIPLDAYPDIVCRKLTEIFGEPFSSFSTDGLVHHFMEIARLGDIARHVYSGRTETIQKLADLLHKDCGFIRESAFQVEIAEGANGPITNISIIGP